MSSAIGIVTPSACGRSVAMTRRMTAGETPLVMSVSACSIMNGTIRMNVKTRRLSRSGASVSRAR